MTVGNIIFSESVEPLGFYDFDGQLSNRPETSGPPDGVFTGNKLCKKH